VIRFSQAGLEHPPGPAPVGGRSRRRSRRHSRGRRQRGGEPAAFNAQSGVGPYMQYESNVPLTYGYSTGGVKLGPMESSLANPAPITRTNNCRDADGPSEAAYRVKSGGHKRSHKSRKGGKRSRSHKRSHKSRKGGKRSRSHKRSHKSNKGGKRSRSNKSRRHRSRKHRSQRGGNLGTGASQPAEVKHYDR